MMTLRNWSNTYEFQAPQYAEPGSIEELQEVVSRASHVRALGTRHSFNPIADTEGTLVSAIGIPTDPVIDPVAQTVEFGAGTRYGVLALYLQSEGWALHNMGSLPHISVGGAISTGTHGSGDLNGNLSTAVRGLQLVGADGSLRWVRKGDPDFPGSVVSLGALGIIVRIVLAIEPTYLVRQDVYRGLEWDRLIADVPALMGAAYSVSAFTDWVSPTVQPIWVKRRVHSIDDGVPDELLGAWRDETLRQQIIESAAEDNTTQHGVAGPWVEHLPHFRADTTPSGGNELQSEYFVDRRDAGEAIRALRTMAADIKELLMVTEFRTIAADDLWLSTANGRDSFAFHFTWLPDLDAARKLCTRIEGILEPYAPRPHWGKVHTVAPETIAAAYPKLDDFLALVQRHDPEGKFRSPYLDLLLSGAGAVRA